MIQVSEIVNAPEFAQAFTILRSTGAWNTGVWESTQATVAGFGTITPATENDIKMIPEGDVVEGAMVFHSQAPIYLTHADGSGAGGSSDILVWQGFNYRVLSVRQEQDYGYYRAIAVRMAAR
jgi:hypothetical protein